MKRSSKNVAAAVGAALLMIVAPAVAAPKKPKPEPPVQPVPPPAPGPIENHASKPEGTWLLDLAFDSGLTVQQLLTLHHNGTVTESDAQFGAASGVTAPYFLAAGDGQGTWERATAGELSIQLHKLAYCGTLPAEQPAAPAPEVPCLEAGLKSGEFYGFLRIRMSANVDGDRLDSAKGLYEAVLIRGADPLALPAVDFGPASATGERLAHPDKHAL